MPESNQNNQQNENQNNQANEKESVTAAAAEAAAAAAAGTDGSKDGASKDGKGKDSLLDKDENNESTGVKKDDSKKLDLLAGKYKNVDELVKGYSDLTKKLTESGKLAPDNYDLKLPAGLQVEKDDPLLKTFSDVAKKYNLPNDAFNEFVKLKLEADAVNVPDPAAEMEKLGKNGKELVGGISKFYSSKLTAAEFDQVKGIAVTAEGVKLLDKLRKLGGNTQPPKGGDGDSKGGATPEEAETALAKAREAEQKGAPDAAALRKEAVRMFNEAYPEKG